MKVALVSARRLNANVSMLILHTDEGGDFGVDDAAG